jgi:hypothetical protein
MDGNCIYQANNDMCPLGVNPRKKKKEANLRREQNVFLISVMVK